MFNDDIYQFNALIFLIGIIPPNPLDIIPIGPGKKEVIFYAIDPAIPNTFLNLFILYSFGVLDAGSMILSYTISLTNFVAVVGSTGGSAYGLSKSTYSGIGMISLFR